MKFEDKLQSLRKKSNLSQEALAQELGVSRQAVSKWESGSSYPEMDKLIMMCKIFKCSLDDLVNETTTDKQVIEKVETKSIGYFNSIINGIVKTVNMFCSMKFTSLLKCLIEMFILGIILFGISAIILSISYSVLEIIVNRYDYLSAIGIFIFFAIAALVVMIDIIVFYQVFKVRYLDYYDQISYTKNQGHEFADDNEEKDNNKRFKFNNQADKIIIRDPNNHQIKIFSLLSKIIKFIIKSFDVGFSFCLIAGIFFLVILEGLSFYLMFIHKIFIGSTICGLCILILSIYLLVILIKYLFNKGIKMWPFIITLISCLVIGALSVSFIILCIHDLNIVKTDGELMNVSKNIKYEENLIITSQFHSSIDYIIDDTLKDIVVEYSYYKDNHEVIINNNKNNVYNFILRFNDDGLEMFNEFIDNLKNNKVVLNDYSEMPNIVIKGNTENIKNIIKNTSKYRIVEDFITNDDGYSLTYGELLNQGSVCEYNKLGYFKCYDIINNSDCGEFSMNDGKLIYDDSKCSCYKDSLYSYLCHRNLNN